MENKYLKHWRVLESKQKLKGMLQPLKEVNLYWLRSVYMWLSSEGSVQSAAPGYYYSSRKLQTIIYKECRLKKVTVGGNLHLKEEMKAPEMVNMWVNIKGKLWGFLICF